MSDDDGDCIFRPQTLINNTYRIEKLIGIGGTGEVYRAHNTASGDDVAIKVLLPQLSTDEKFIDLMRRGQKLLHDIIHPSIVRYYQFQRTSGEPDVYFLVMQYIEGPSLADLMEEKGPVDPNILTRIARRMLAGLEVCHRVGVVHRDISPDNIILLAGEPDQATLIDFDIAKDERPEAKTIVGERFAGKLEYASPEQIKGRATKQSDLYSLGATLLAAARGTAPEADDLLAGKMQPLEPSGIPEPLATMIRHVGQPRSEKRPQDARAALDILDGTVPDVTLQEPDPDPLYDDRPGLDEDGDLFGIEQDPVEKPVPEEPKSVLKEKPRRGWLLPTLGVGVIAAGMAAYALLLPPALPERSPYTLDVVHPLADAPTARGHAMSQGDADLLARAVRERLGQDAEIEIEPATGAPNDRWQAMASTAIALLGQLREGKLSMEDGTVVIEGIASDRSMIDAIDGAGRSGAVRNGYEIELALKLHIPPLALASVDRVARGLSDCGELSIRTPRQGEGFDPEETIVLRGALSSEETRAALAEALTDIAEERPVNLEGVIVLNPSVCRIRKLLPLMETSDIELVDTSELTGARSPETYMVGDTPIVEARVNPDLTGYFYAFIVDDDENVAHIIPAPGRALNEVQKIGRVENDERIRRINNPAQLREDDLREIQRMRREFGLSAEQAKNAYLVQAPAFSYDPESEFVDGHWIFYALVTPEPLFAFHRAEIEDTREFAPALAKALKKNLEISDKIIYDQKIIRYVPAR